MERQNATLFLRYFGIKHLSDLIGRKFLINIQLPTNPYDFGPTEVCFLVDNYTFSSQNICFIVPTIGLEGNTDIKDVILTFYLNHEEARVEYGISFTSDYHMSEYFPEKKEYFSIEGRKGSKKLRVKLL